MTADAPAKRTIPEAEVGIGGAISVDELSAKDVLVMAATVPVKSRGPVDEALAQALATEDPTFEVPWVNPAEIDYARPERKYSLTHVRDFPMPDGPASIVIMRGDLEAVVRASTTTRDQRNQLRKSAQTASMRGCRPLGVASATVDADGTVSPYRVHGFVSVKPKSAKGFSTSAAANPGEWVRVNLWSAMLRFQHWLNVVLIFIMSCTGYYIMDPFFGPSYNAGVETGYLMGWVRFIHFTAAFIWLVVGLSRVVLAFTSKDRYLRWPTFWPLKSKSDVKNLGKVAQFYLFIKRHAPLYLAHNPLQQLAYTSIYVLGFGQMLLGLSLYSLYHPTNPLWAFLMTPAAWVGIPMLRLLHAAVMFIMWAFVIMHIYMAIRADTLERHGGVSSMVNGGVWLHKGSKPVDAPEIL